MAACHLVASSRRERRGPSEIVLAERFGDDVGTKDPSHPIGYAAGIAV
ncbi:hypothetical protein MMAN_52460 [Mycobacterium mantenii]|uniref:Uncharacterized protein n=1 Tax=Mycobacterium mantenii TaxID=560555 RepID=A0ABM7JZV8_MYCNT|nr:hypothetical protein [Mycobacterium mantenii]MCV7243012.1 hypothetical protein [Mycobacterium mantenii]BBY41112.1 hypothetical protein MMAN_52460 [Mycobacterium mantenii]